MSYRLNANQSVVQLVLQKTIDVSIPIRVDVLELGGNVSNKLNVESDDAEISEVGLSLVYISEWNDYRHIYASVTRIKAKMAMTAMIVAMMVVVIEVAVVVVVSAVVNVEAVVGTVAAAAAVMADFLYWVTAVAEWDGWGYHSELFYRLLWLLFWIPVVLYQWNMTLLESCHIA